MNKLTNQELVKELEKRIDQGHLEVRAIPEQFEKRTKSLFSCLDSEDLLLLAGLTVVLTFLLFQSLKLTTNSVTEYSVGFRELEN